MILLDLIRQDILRLILGILRVKNGIRAVQICILTAFSDVPINVLI